jgi:hypothetical protein
MKNYGLYILIYNLLGVTLCLTDWIYKVVTLDLGYFGTYTSERYNFIDFADTPFYFLGVFCFFWTYKKQSKIQKTYFATALLFLINKYLNLDFGYTMFFVWNYLILLINV